MKVFWQPYYLKHYVKHWYGTYPCLYRANFSFYYNVFKDFLSITRRCKGNATSETARSKQIEAKNLESTQYTYVDSSNNNAYFVLEPGSHISELDDTTKAESESPYNDLPEGEYDLLRDKDSRRKVSDDTYATSAKPSDYSDYDVTNRNRQTEEDSTYDHAGSNTTSLYGYGSVQHQEQDENAYSTSEYWQRLVLWGDVSQSVTFIAIILKYDISEENRETFYHALITE